MSLYHLLTTWTGQISAQIKADSRLSVIFLGILNGDILRGFDWNYLLHKSTLCVWTRFHGRRLWLLWGWLRHASWWNTGCQFDLLLEVQPQGILTALKGTSTARKIWTLTYQLLRQGQEALKSGGRHFTSMAVIYASQLTHGRFGRSISTYLWVTVVRVFADKQGN